MATTIGTTFTSTGTATTIFASAASDYGTGVTGATNFLNNSLAALDVFSLSSTLTPTTHTKTQLTGHDPSANGTVSMTGTGFVGTNGNLQMGAKGSISYMSFTGDGGGSFEIAGSIRWTETVGIDKGFVTLYHAKDVAGNEYTFRGQMQIQGTPGGLTFTGGNVNHITLHTQNGFNFDITGKIDLSTGQGSVTQVIVSDAAHHSVTMYGSFSAADVFAALGTGPTVGDFFENTHFNSGNDIYTIPDGAAHGWSGGINNDRMTGGSGADTMSGGAGNDTLDGGAGADTMDGGTGNDLFYVNNALDVVVEGNLQGTDTVISTLTYTLLADFENLTLTGTTNIDGTGNAGSNVLTGNSGNNTLDGILGGMDTLIGGLGNDTYMVHAATDKVTDTGGYDTVISDADTYVMADNIEEFHAAGGADVLVVTGNALGNYIIGNALVNTLNGGLGNDTLDGGAGNDLLNGGDGNDVYYVDSTGDTVTDSMGTDTIVSTVDLTLGAGIENLSLSGPALVGTGNELANFLIGNAGINTLSGLAGNDTLDGGTGADTLAGGIGNDFYIIDDALDVLTELAGEGTDTVRSFVDKTLGANFENLILAGSAHVGTGNALDNNITGGNGGDTLNGGAGADHLVGGGGNDTYIIDNVKDTLYETINGGTDTVVSSINYQLNNYFENLTLTGTAFSAIGNSAANVLTGNAVANTLSGGGGNDTMDGGGGNDTMTGGMGADLYVMHNATPGTYTITDFKAAEDKIDIHDLLTGYVNGVSDISDFARFIPGATGHSVLQVDADGAVGGANFVTVATVTGSNLDAETLALAGHLLLT